MRRTARVLLAAALASSGAVAPFLHVHAHGAAHPVSAHAGASDEHCAHHHAAGAHWHPIGPPSSEGGRSPAAAAPWGLHAAVALSAAATETPAVRLAAPAVPAAAPETGVLPAPRGARRPVDPTSGPDPPPRAVDAARAPPAPS